LVEAALAPIKKFTYMIIREAIEAAKAAGALIPFNPPVGWSSKPRAFLMTQRLADQIADGLASADPRRVERWDRLRADIANFVENGLMTWASMKWLDPHKFEHWEIKSRRPRPSLRIFGRFAEPNVFVGTHIIERTKLGKKWSQEWELEKLACEEGWKRALGNCPPFHGNNYEDYMTENAHRFPEVPQ
jgi:hypothetical protein